uniref:Ribosomal protein L5 n=1 Tax=California macrophylla TaxID=337344 RepID=A0A0G2YJA4_9ROSI|nr:ribosomal protein L5 [California macrophylla]
MAFSAILRKSESSLVPLASRIIGVERNPHRALFTSINHHTNISSNTSGPSRSYSASGEPPADRDGDQGSRNVDRVGGIPDHIFFHYEDVLRQDLLLKLNRSNITQIPRVKEIRVMPKVTDEATTKTGRLAMEISCSQKFTPSESGSGKSQPNTFVGSKDRGYVPDVIRPTTLRGQAMTNFLLRLLTVMSMSEYKVKIRENMIHFWMDKEFCEFTPELEDHLEIFEHVRGGFNVSIVTTAETKEETKLLWSGLLQKDEGETIR